MPNEILTPEKITRREAVARDTLGSNYIKAMIAAKTSQGPSYGNLGQGIYETGVSNTPDNVAHQQLFAEQLRNGGAVHKEGLFRGATQSTIIAISNLKLSEGLGLLGLPTGTLQAGVGDLYGRQLDPAILQVIFQTYGENVADEAVAATIPTRREVRNGQLENILGNLAATTP